MLTGLYWFRASPQLQPCDAPDGDLPCSGARFEATPQDPLDLGKHMGVFIFAYMCQTNVFTICNEVSDASGRQTDCIIVIAHLISGCVLCFCGLCGYAVYGANISPNMLASMPHDEVMTVTRMMYALVAVGCYPVQCHPTRMALLSLMAPKKVTLLPTPEKVPLLLAFDNEAPETKSPTPSDGVVFMHLMENHRFRLVTLALFAGSLTVASLVDDLGVVYSLLGSTTASVISFIVPGLFYMRAYQEPHAKRILAMALTAFGACSIPILCVFVLI
jgi:amino acid permease